MARTPNVRSGCESRLINTRSCPFPIPIKEARQERPSSGAGGASIWISPRDWTMTPSVTPGNLSSIYTFFAIASIYKKSPEGGIPLITLLPPEFTFLFSCRFFDRCKREGKVEGRAFTHFAIDPDVSTMTMYSKAAEGQANSQAANLAMSGHT